MTIIAAIVTMGGIALLSMAATLALVPALIKTAHRFGIISAPGGHSNHTNPTPLLGGLAVYLPFSLVFLVFLALAQDGAAPEAKTDYAQSLALWIGATWMLVLGTIDDKVSLGWKLKLAGELVGIAILIIGGHTVGSATVPFFGLVHFGWWGMPIFALAVLAITNAINLIDGVDGLAGGICLFAALVSGVIGYAKADYITAAVCFAATGSLLGFLRYNFPPATIFLGDGGSLMLGFVLGALATSSAAVSPGQRSGTLIMVAAPFLPFGIALLDVILAIVRRSLSGRNIFSPDKEHLHHFLMEQIGRPREVVLILYGVSLLLSAITLTLVLAPSNDQVTALLSVAGLLVLVILGVVIRRYIKVRLPAIMEERRRNGHKPPNGDG